MDFYGFQMILKIQKRNKKEKVVPRRIVDPRNIGTAQFMNFSPQSMYFSQYIYFSAFSKREVKSMSQMTMKVAIKRDMRQREKDRIKWKRDKERKR